MLGLHAVHRLAEGIAVGNAGHRGAHHRPQGLLQTVGTATEEAQGIPFGEDAQGPAGLGDDDAAQAAGRHQGQGLAHRIGWLQQLDAALHHRIDVPQAAEESGPQVEAEVALADHPHGLARFAGHQQVADALFRQQVVGVMHGHAGIGGIHRGAHHLIHRQLAIHVGGEGPQDVPFGDDAHHQGALAHQQGADAGRFHDFRRRQQGGPTLHLDDIPGHQVCEGAFGHGVRPDKG